MRVPPACLDWHCYPLLDDNSIVYIAIKDRNKNDLLCVFGLKDEPYIQ